MKSFLKTFFAVVCAFVFILFFVFFFFIGGLMSSGEKSPSLQANSILNLTLKGEITDRAYNNPFRNISPVAALTGSVDDASTIGLYELKAVLKHAKKDEKIKGILLNIDEVQANPATLFDVRAALIDFKNSNKFIYAYSNSTPELNFAINTVADKFYINPLGDCEFDGFAMQMDYYKGLMDKLGIEYKVFYVGEYKSATESFRRTDMSPEDRLQRSALLNSIASNYLKDLETSTKISLDSLQHLQNTLAVMTATEAVKYGLANGVKYEDEVMDEIKTKLGYKKTDDLNMISYNKYNEIVKAETKKSKEQKIAVVYAEGVINDSKSDDGVIGGKAYTKILQDIEKNKDIKALVLRVNSPGGSAFASEQIYHYLKKIKAKIPIVVSMGDYAASGGYYISSISNKIIAQPNTLTGSIGIFGMIPNIRKAMNDKVGVTFDEVSTSPHANFFNLINDWDELETSKVQKQVEFGYSIFLDRVSSGRNMDTAAVNKVARGRVWTGQDALKIGLVDELGGLELAIQRAKEIAKIKDAEVVEYPKSKSMVENIVSEILGDKEDAQSKMMKNLTPQVLYFKQLEQIQSLGIYQYKMPYDLKIR
ncbi:MAG: signal peptide peptidase SppA [Chitinophagales bacterium]